MAEDSEVEEELEKCNMVCKGLAKYYASKNVEYEGRVFYEWCLDNGMNDESLEEEIQDGNYKNAQMTEFDDNFPSTLDGEAKQQEIFETIKYIFKNDGNCTFDVNLPSIESADFFDVNDQDIELVRKEYSKQCPALWAAGMENDVAFLKILAVGMKLRKKGEDFRYLEFIINDYFRSRVNNMNKNKGNNANDSNETTTTKRDPWFDEKHVRFISKLGKSKQSNPVELVENAVKSFGARCCPKLMFASLFSIDDSIEIHCQYIVACLNWISEIITTADKENKTVCPFQIDLCFAVGQPASTEKKNEYTTTTTNGDDQGDDDDDDDDEYEVKGGGAPKKYEGYIDVIGNIKDKLEANNLKYTISPFDTEKEEPNTRFYNDMIKKLRTELNDQVFPLKGKGSSLYPHSSRFITMIDRREKKGKDDVFMYTAPGDCRDIPTNYVPEWFVSSSKSTLLPDKEYGDGKNALKAANDDKKQDETKEKLQNANVNSGFHCKGGLLTMSFIVEEAERIKAYLYYNGQMHYFQPKDVRDVFPTIYNMEKPENKEFIAKKADRYITQMEQKLKDKYLKKFQEFYVPK